MKIFFQSTQSCVLKPGCTNLKCGASGVEATFSEAVFGTLIDVTLDGRSPKLTQAGYAFDCDLGDCGMQHKVIGNDVTGYMLVKN